MWWIKATGTMIGATTLPIGAALLARWWADLAAVMTGAAKRRTGIAASAIRDAVWRLETSAMRRIEITGAA